MDELLQAECVKECAYGPFSEALFEQYRVSPSGVVTGKYSGKKQLIIDLSSPQNSRNHCSINELIDREQSSLTYVKIDDAIKKICEYGKGAVLC